jgi:uncharacterized RDD family membrane protein YckC
MKAATLDERALERRIVTPEGIPLRIEVARAGDRVGGFLLDGVLQVGAILVLWGLIEWFTDFEGDWPRAFWLIGLFVVPVFYFIWFEIRWQGRTPGKRAVGTRVMDAAGGPLRSEAVIVRNLMRELEIWIPVRLAFASDELWPGAPGWMRTFFSVWAFVFLLMPLFNRNRMRAGDLVAGTMVVLAPKSVLLPDLGVAASAEPVHGFTEEQLSVYGIYELQVLEDLLRRTDAGRREAFEAVATQIRKKIGYHGDVKTERFLREFYAAQRARLERKILLGKRKKDKFAKG